MRVGTKSVLFGVHAIWIHPFFVAWAWWRLFGFPWDPKLWFAFALHDAGYVFRPNIQPMIRPPMTTCCSPSKPSMLGQNM